MYDESDRVATKNLVPRQTDLLKPSRILTDAIRKVWDSIVLQHLSLFPGAGGGRGAISCCALSDPEKIDLQIGIFGGQ